jgi:hypothetical protein
MRLPQCARTVTKGISCLERAMGIEPAFSAREAGISMLQLWHEQGTSKHNG